ncbi:MAG: 16S rRNA (cytosine(1402)-N(4))-methyltransferase RsmH [Dehalococcoidia bacterium]|nr:16S rRNA (cytosine(1402)-N(4))-methyltransferase RsmH [Dehalococcoidia bacterium]
MLPESIQALSVQPGGTYIDCTLGEGGHTEALIQGSQSSGKVLGLDADSEAIARAHHRFALYKDRVVLVQENFRHLEAVAKEHGFRNVDGVVFDVGINTRQLASGRGFSFREDAPLDMRFDTRQDLTADDVVNRYSEHELAKVLTEYGEEPHARRIAKAMVHARPIRTAAHLGQVVQSAAGYAGGRIHPATRTFQAIRIEVNQELKSLEDALHQAVRLLKPGGRVAVISFHSLEDRIVKQAFNQESRECVCPPSAPVCVCNHTPMVRTVEPRLWRPSPQEVGVNIRSRSARMRVAERLREG